MTTIPDQHVTRDAGQYEIHALVVVMGSVVVMPPPPTSDVIKALLVCGLWTGCGHGGGDFEGAPGAHRPMQGEEDHGIPHALALPPLPPLLPPPAPYSQTRPHCRVVPGWHIVLPDRPCIAH